MPNQAHEYSVVVGAELVAPAGAAVIADTGQLPKGTYEVDIALAAADAPAAGKGILVQHRDAANAATNAIIGSCAAGSSNQVNLKGIVVAQNERIRAVVMAQAGAALSEFVATIAVRMVRKG